MSAKNRKSFILTAGRAAAVLASLLGVASLQSCSSAGGSGEKTEGAAAESGSFQADVTADPVPTAPEAEVAAEISTIQREGDESPSRRMPASKRLKRKRGQMSQTDDDDSDEDGASVSGKGSKRRSRRPSSSSGSMSYTVREGDTLMKISFKAYADPLRWREIYEDNKEKIPNPNSLVKGAVFTLRTSQFAEIDKNGDPYHIKKHDTLSKISAFIYGTISKWRKLWKNNPQLIRDPNKIYAGFTLYFTRTDQEKQEAERRQGPREVAPVPLSSKKNVLTPGQSVATAPGKSAEPAAAERTPASGQSDAGAVQTE